MLAERPPFYGESVAEIFKAVLQANFSPACAADRWAATHISRSDLSRLPLSLRLFPFRVSYSSKMAKVVEASSLSGKQLDTNEGEAPNPRQEVTTASESCRRHLWLDHRRTAAGGRPRSGGDTALGSMGILWQRP
ncbi:hypothetical protein U1Q18_049532 [Sarracenia purpurea var. burkii]